MADRETTDPTRTAILTVARTWFGAALDATTRVTLSRRAADGPNGDGGALRIDIDAPFHGNPAPHTHGIAASPSRCLDGLWNHEVVEVFIGAADPARDPAERAYIELEFGPFGHALGLRFDGYRRRIGTVDLPGSATIDGDRWRGVAHVRAQDLPPEPWELNAFVIFDRKTERIYGASYPTSDDQPPDFHHRKTWRVTTLV